MSKDPQKYLIIAENASRSSRFLSHYQSLEAHKSKLWGFLSKPPTPSWYPQAKEVLQRAIELTPEEDSFGLYFDGESRTITLYPRNKKYRSTIEKTISDFIRAKRKEERAQRGMSLAIGDFAQSSPSREETSSQEMTRYEDASARMIKEGLKRLT